MTAQQNEIVKSPNGTKPLPPVAQYAAPALSKFAFLPTAEQMEVIKNQICADLKPGELLLFLEVCKARGLNPILNQIYAIRRYNKKYIDGDWKDFPVMTIQTAIEGFTLIAERTGRYDGCKTWTTGDLKDPKNITLKGHAKVYKKGSQAFEVEIEYSEFVPTYKDKKGETRVQGQWATKPKWMIQKVALARALSRAFPEDLSGLNTDDELPDYVDATPEPTSPALESLNAAIKGTVLDPTVPIPVEERTSEIKPLENPWLHIVEVGAGRGSRLCQLDDTKFGRAYDAWMKGKKSEADYVNMKAAIEESPHLKQAALDELAENDGLEDLFPEEN